MRVRAILFTLITTGAAPAFAWTPNDPYFKPVPVSDANPVVPRRQWGLSVMNFDWAWNTTRGNAYVGVLDAGMPGNLKVLGMRENGLKIVSFEPHEDLVANVRTQFSRTPYVQNVDTSRPLAEDRSWHATHVAGIIGASANNGIGIAGGCPTCSIAAFPIAHTGEGLYLQPLEGEFGAYSEALTRAVYSGMQVINWSGELPNDDNHTNHHCNVPTANLSPVCAAVQLLKDRDVLLIQATGNFSKTRPPFPSNIQENQSTILAVGGTSSREPGPSMGGLSSGALWRMNATEGSSWAGFDGVVAPADGIVSTVPRYPGSTDDYYPAYKCGDFANDRSAEGNVSRLGDGYGSCSGTSMAAPHVSALAGLIRSVNPLLSAQTVRSIIQNSGNNASNRMEQIGYGLPNAGLALVKASTTNPSKLTPLFSFYSAERVDSFYTTVPQMASAALTGTLEPRQHCPLSAAQCDLETTFKSYDSAYGAGITDWGNSYGPYTKFPGAGNGSTKAPQAEVWVFTTPTNPKSAAIPLAPLVRMSWICPSAQANTVCQSTNGHHTDTTYTTDDDGIAAYTGVGYKVDGIEGYIYPKSLPQPTGTVRLMRKYNPTKDDHAIFPETKAGYMAGLGYTVDSGAEWLGYVYPNNGPVPVIQ
ncbi:S8 family serine peptidase [Acidovorax sp. NCPPB 4044]|uniref:S8 family serine peptidase n=1 Tax=Acidovorax sp. NCPPB 4044 TaxID=2940490 RepID=UPI002303F1B0|nr:S8 family serine peptidase [Acidovorax sp. NCPPB 4044]MDA8521732.1 S8 family serine peptidase [Acidovorax sp. NCPPB 4044]